MCSLIAVGLYVHWSYLIRIWLVMFRIVVFTIRGPCICERSDYWLKDVEELRHGQIQSPFSCYLFSCKALIFVTPTIQYTAFQFVKHHWNIDLPIAKGSPTPLSYSASSIWCKLGLESRFSKFGSLLLDLAPCKAPATSEALIFKCCCQWSWPMLSVWRYECRHDSLLCIRYRIRSTVKRIYAEWCFLWWPFIESWLLGRLDFRGRETCPTQCIWLAGLQWVCSAASIPPLLHGEN